MGTLTRKQREIAEREDLILDVAFPLLLEKGYLGLTMDRIADAAEYSKGTIYQHFTCKEEIVAALGIRSAEKRIELFERAATFRGSSRERVTAIGVADALFVRLYPEHFQIEKILTTTSIRQKLPEGRRQAMDACEMGCFEVMSGIIRDAIAQGDLDQGTPETGLQIAFGLWSMAVGGHLIGASPDGALERKMGVSDTQDLLDTNYQLFLDGTGWKPLSTEHDYTALIQGIHDEVFPDEWRRVQSA